MEICRALSLYRRQGSARGKEHTCQYRRRKKGRFRPWVGKIPGGGHGNPIQYSCPWTESPQTEEPLRVRSQRVSNRSDLAHTCTHTVLVHLLNSVGMCACERERKIFQLTSDIFTSLCFNDFFQLSINLVSMKCIFYSPI